jgi:hypothetical protein
MCITHNITVPLAALLSAAALAGPAWAIPADAASQVPTLQANPQPIVEHTATANAQSSGFDWSSAGIGAAGGVGAFAIALAGTTGIRRRRVARPRSIASH